jgi:hypothetical protein
MSIWDYLTVVTAVLLTIIMVFIFAASIIIGIVAQ